MAAEIPAELKTPISSFPQDLHTGMIYTGTPCSTLHDVVPSSGVTAGGLAAAVPLPALGISTIPVSAPTEVGEGFECSEQATTRHDRFYFEDGNVEIVCGDTTFRVHSTVILTSPSKLQDILFPPNLLDAPVPEGRHLVTVSDNAEDFEALLGMIYTPGWVALPFEVKLY